MVGLREININTCMYLEHNVMEDVVRNCFSLSTFMLEVVLKLPNNLSHGLPSSLGQGDLILLEEGVQVNVLHQF